MPDADELLRRLTDPANPRTPLHFKLLDHQQPGRAPFLKRAAPSTRHRTEGYACGVLVGSPRPITKWSRGGDGA